MTSPEQDTGQRQIADYERARECPGGLVDDVYRGLAVGFCPSCGEVVPLLLDGDTVRHFGGGQRG